MKRYALLAGFTYYPSPGWTALIDCYDKIEEAVDAGKKKAEDDYVGGWYQVVDMQTGKIVAGEGEGHTGLYGKFAANPGSK